MTALSPRAPRPADPPAPWRLHRLFSAPHRLAFAAASGVLLASVAWWAAVMMGGSLGIDGPAALPASTVHALLTSFGFMPLFFAGFLFTAGPRWLGLLPEPAQRLAGAVRAQLAGWALLVLATVAPDDALARTLGALGVAAAALGWGQVALRFMQLCRDSQVPDRLHARLIAAAGAVGTALMAASAAALAAGEFGWVHACARAGLWGFVGVVFAVVSHRMVPYFDGAGLPWPQPGTSHALLGSFVGVLLLEGAAALSPPAAPLRPALAAVEAVAAAAWLALALQGARQRRWRQRLPAMLLVGLAWLGLAMALSAASHALQWAGRPGLGGAPLHAFTMGFLGSTMMATVGRVSAAHAGRAWAVDAYAWTLFKLLQVAVIARIMADLAGVPTLAPAAALWAAAWLPWGARHLGWYGRPRADGRSGCAPPPAPIRHTPNHHDQRTTP